MKINLVQKLWKKHLGSMKLDFGNRRRIFKSKNVSSSILSSCDITTQSLPLLPIETEFNKEYTKKFEFKRRSIGLFGLPQLTEPTGFVLLEKDAIEEAKMLMKECLETNRSRKMIEIFDDLSNCLCKTADLAEFIYMAHPDADYAYHAETARNTVGGLVEQLNTNRRLYDSLRSAVNNGDVAKTTEIDQHVAKLLLFDFEQSGIHLDKEQRQLVTHLNDKILHLGSRFQKAILEKHSIPVSKLPEPVRKSLGKNTASIEFDGFLDSYRDEAVREYGYRTYLSPNKGQEETLTKLLTARHDLAVTCGFESYAHRSLKGSLAETPDLVNALLDKLNADIQPAVQQEMKQMKDIKRSSGSDKPVAPWDLSYLSSLGETLRMKSTSENEIRPYFSLGTVMSGLSTLFENLYGVSLSMEATSYGEIWHPEVKKLAVVHENEGTLGHIYCDLFSRDGKSAQDCQFTIKGGKLLADDTYQNPVSVLHMNLHSPTASAPPLLSFAMLDNVFHEMGHGIHSMLGRTQYQHVAGTRCPTDFAEVPSILMEFFARDPRVLQRISRHVRTGDQIPLDLLNQFLASRNVFPAIDLQRQIFYSAFDQRFHGVERWPDHVNTMDILAETQSKYFHLPHVENTAYHLKFGHIVGYGAKYYSYLMSRAVASWIWQKYFQENPFNRDAGERFRKEVLSHGGGKPPKKMIGDFLAMEVTPDTLANALLTDIESKKYV